MLSEVVCALLFVCWMPVDGQDPEFEGGFLPVIEYSKPLNKETNNVKRDAGDQTLYRNHVKNQGGIAEKKEQFVVPVGFAEDRPGFDFSVPLQGSENYYAIDGSVLSRNTNPYLIIYPMTKRSEPNIQPNLDSLLPHYSIKSHPAHILQHNNLLLKNSFESPFYFGLKSILDDKNRKTNRLFPDDPENNLILQDNPFLFFLQHNHYTDSNEEPDFIQGIMTDITRSHDKMSLNDDTAKQDDGVMEHRKMKKRETELEIEQFGSMSDSDWEVLADQPFHFEFKKNGINFVNNNQPSITKHNSEVHPSQHELKLEATTLKRALSNQEFLSKIKKGKSEQKSQIIQAPEATTWTSVSLTDRNAPLLKSRGQFKPIKHVPREDITEKIQDRMDKETTSTERIHHGALLNQRRSRPEKPNLSSIKNTNDLKSNIKIIPQIPEKRKSIRVKSIRRQEVTARESDNPTIKNIPQTSTEEIASSSSIGPTRPRKISRSRLSQADSTRVKPETTNQERTRSDTKHNIKVATITSETSSSPQLNFPKESHANAPILYPSHPVSSPFLNTTNEHSVFPGHPVFSSQFSGNWFFNPAVHNKFANISSQSPVFSYGFSSHDPGTAPSHSNGVLNNINPYVFSNNSALISSPSQFVAGIPINNYEAQRIYEKEEVSNSDVFETKSSFRNAEFLDQTPNLSDNQYHVIDGTTRSSLSIDEWLPLLQLRPPPSSTPPMKSHS